jgi:hypothetical protein
MAAIAREEAPKLATILIMSFVLGVAMPRYALADENWPEHTQHLFNIERSQNANIVQYDVVLNEDGSLNRDNPIISYWIRKAEDGRRQPLSLLERKLAYGFNTRVLDDGTILMDMKADIRRMVHVERKADTWVAITRIDGHSACIERIYVMLEESKPLPKVEYVDLYGSDNLTGESVHERFFKR